MTTNSLFQRRKKKELMPISTTAIFLLGHPNTTACYILKNVKFSIQFILMDTSSFIYIPLAHRIPFIKFVTWIIKYAENFQGDYKNLLREIISI